MNLIDARVDVLRSVAGSTCAVDFPGLPVALADLLEARAASLKPLQDRNANRKREVEAAILLAADRALSERNRRYVSPRNYAGLLHQYLQHRYSAFGLSSRPCLRSIRSALIDWTPPISGA